MNKLPIITSLNDVEIKKIYGQSVFDYYQQVKKLFASHAKSAEVKTFFAEPAINKSRQEISWYTDIEGPIIPIGMLSDQERVLASAKLSTYYNDIIKVADEFTAVQGARSLGAEALKAMLVTPRISESLFIVGDKLVLTEWGCIPFGSLPEVYDLIIQDRSFHKISTPSPVYMPAVIESVHGLNETLDTPDNPPVNHEIASDEESIPNIEDAHVEPPVTDNNNTSEKVVSRRPWWLYWVEIIKWLLLLLLLLLLIYGLFTRIWYIKLSSTDAQIADNKLTLQRDISNLWSRADELLKECKTDFDGKLDKPTPTGKTDQKLNESKNNNNDKGNNEETPVTDNHQNTQTPNDTSNQSSSQALKENSDPSNIINQQAQEEMRIPKNKKDLSFLQGCWKSSTPAYDSSTHVPLELKYCFEGDKGTGQFLINLSDGDKCSAPLQAKRQGKFLYMSYTTINCASRQYPPAKIICHQENSIALCNHIDIINGADEPIEGQILAAKFLKIDGN